MRDHPAFHGPAFLGTAFQEPSFYGLALPGPALPGSAFHGPSFHGSVFRGSAFYGPAFREPSFHGPAFREPSFHGPAFREPSFHGPAFREPSFYGPAFREPSFYGPAFREPSFHGPALHGPALHEPSFPGAALYEPSFPGAAFYRSALHGPALHEPSFHEPSLPGHPGDHPGPGGRPDHGDHPMTRPDDPATPAAPVRPASASAPMRAAEIPPRTTARPAPGATARRGPADPVKSLLHHHRDLCERAVDPLEIAAGLEAHGLTDRTAARYRHRDVFALAEELYARMPPRTREPATGRPPGPGPDTDARAAWTLLALLPGAACLATAGVLRVTEGVLGDGTRALVTVVGAVLACLALRACLGRGPLRAPEGAGRAGMYGCWLLSYAVYGEELLAQVMTGGPDGPWDGTPAPLLGLAAAVAPGAWCAHLFTVHAHRKLTGSRALEEFGAGVRPLLLAAVTLFLGALLPLLYLADLGLGGGGAPVAAVALGVLFFVARLLAAHGLPEPGTLALAAACAIEAGAVALVLSARLPGLEPLARPVNALVSAGGTGAVPTLACGGAAAGLLLYAAFALSRASAHIRP